MTRSQVFDVFAGRERKRGGSNSNPKRLFAIAGLSIAFVWVSIWLRFRNFESEPPPEPTDLRAWDFLGCYQLQIESWSSDPEQAPPVVRHLLLLPDSVDQWGRQAETYRAVPLDPGVEEEDVNVRWFTRADTLWFVWSDPQARGGAALRRNRDRMVGRAVAELQGPQQAEMESAVRSLEANAAAWEVNCHSLRPDRIGPVAR